VKSEDFWRLPTCGRDRAIRSNLFYRFAVKKDFRCYPGRMGEQQFCEAKLRPAPGAAG
jgi:hypothetical protein